ncbi:ATP-binding protein [Micromonospora mangrovi]|uniref:ATP-binding protein n=2 Tax=Micromonospora TaxID=1873 RepID=A0AAU7MAR7_9ACTN
MLACVEICLSLFRSGYGEPLHTLAVPAGQDPPAMSELTARLDVPLGVNAPSTARRALVAVLQGWGYCDEDWLGTAALVTSELITNAVRHGGGCVDFSVESHDGRVVVSVADGSSVVPRRRDPDGIGGCGLAVIEAISTSWGVHDHEGGKRVWVELTTHPVVCAAQTSSSREIPE